MSGDYRVSGNIPKHRTGDFRVGIDQSTSQFALIAAHNRNVRAARQTLGTTLIGGVQKKFDGIQTRLNCDHNRKVFVKTFKDGTSKVWEEN